MPMTNIAFIVNRVAPTGPLFVVQDIVACLSPSEYKVLLVELRTSVENRKMPIMSQRNVRVVSLGYSLWQLETKTRKVAKKLRELFVAEKIEIAHSHSYHGDLTLAHLKGDLPRLTSQHNFMAADYLSSKGTILGNFMALRQTRAICRFDYVVGIARGLADYYEQKLKQKVPVIAIPNGINMERFVPVTPKRKVELRSQLDLPKEAFIVVMVGGIITVKNPLLPIRAIKWLKKRERLVEEFCFLFVGDGALEEKAKNEAAPLGASIRFEGRKNDVLPYLQAADAIFSASHSEGFGLSIVEGIATGCLSILSDLSAFREIVSCGNIDVAYFFNQKSEEACANAIAKVFDQKSSTSEYERFRTFYSRERMAQDYCHLYDVLRNKKNS